MAQFWEEFITIFRGSNWRPNTGFICANRANLVFMAACVVVWLFFEKQDRAWLTSAAGSNPMFARYSGINVDMMRILGTTISTALGAIGIITYSQSHGFLQLYNAAF